MSQSPAKYHLIDNQLYIRDREIQTITESGKIIPRTVWRFRCSCCGRDSETRTGQNQKPTARRCQFHASLRQGAVEVVHNRALLNAFDLSVEELAEMLMQISTSGGSGKTGDKQVESVSAKPPKRRGAPTYTPSGDELDSLVDALGSAYRSDSPIGLGGGRDGLYQQVDRLPEFARKMSLKSLVALCRSLKVEGRLKVRKRHPNRENWKWLDAA